METHVPPTPTPPPAPPLAPPPPPPTSSSITTTTRTASPMVLRKRNPVGPSETEKKGRKPTVRSKKRGRPPKANGGLVGAPEIGVEGGDVAPDPKDETGVLTRRGRFRGLKRVQKEETDSSEIPVKMKSRWKRSNEFTNGIASDGHSSDEPLVPINSYLKDPPHNNKTTPLPPEHPDDNKENNQVYEKVESIMENKENLEKEELQERLRSFQHITENIFLCERRSNKQSRGMECDCSLTKEEVSVNKKGCGENCLNRLLKIECSKFCSLGKLCGNKKFQNVENAPVEVFKTDNKGFGIRATADIPDDTFIMEYIGEVLDAKQFRKRAKQYAKDGVVHFYFMALSSEYCIDAGSKGNNSRFINHSCSPNAETQKWMVNGEMRVGFFTKKKIPRGEEITFDYKYERYGQQAQKCFCGSDICRGWLGGEPNKRREPEAEEEDDDDDDYWSSSAEDDEEEEPESKKEKILPQTVKTLPVKSLEEEEKKKDKDFVLQVNAKSEVKSTVELPKSLPKKRRRRRKSPRKIKNYEDAEDEDEIEKLKTTGIRTKNHTVELSRIMVRSTDVHSRAMLASLLQNADKPCRRLFLDYYGLRILYGWMSEPIWDDVRELDLKIQILDILSILSIPHKTMLVDCKIWSLVCKWSTRKFGDSSEDISEVNSRATSPSINVEFSESSLVTSVSIETEENKVELPLPQYKKESLNKEESKPLADTIKNEDKENIKTLSEQPALTQEVFQADIKPVSKVEPSWEEKEDKIKEELEGKCKIISEKSSSLLSSWQSLKEVFKIPKKDRVALRAEHEREVDQAAAITSMTPNLVAQTVGTATQQNNVRRNNYASFPSNGNGGSSSKVSSYTSSRPLPRPDSPSNKRTCSRFDDRTGLLHLNNLSKEHRRHLFSLKAEQEEEEKRKRELLQEHHNNKCFYLNLSADETPMFPHYPAFVFNPEDGNWYQMPEPYPKVDVSWGYATMAELPPEAYKEGDEPLPDRACLYPPGVVPVSFLYGIALTTPEDYYSQYPHQYHHQQHQQPQEIIDIAPSVQLKRPDYPPVLESSEDYMRISTPFSASPGNILKNESDLLTDHQDSSGPILPVKLKEISPSASLSNVVVKSKRSEVIIRLPPDWKMAQDPNGRPYFYNLSTKETQWTPPSGSGIMSEEDVSKDEESIMTNSVVEVDTLSTDSEDDNNEEEDSDDEDDEESEDENSLAGGSGNSTSTSETKMDEITSDLSQREKEILLNLPKKKTKEERQHERRQKRERDREKREYERKRRRERHGQHRRDGLVQEYLIPRRSENEKRDLMSMREIKERMANRDVIREKQALEERLQAEKERKLSSINNTSLSSGGHHSNQGASSLGYNPNIDTNSDHAKRIKDRFLKEASKVIVKILDPYRRTETTKGPIKSIEDFKHLARKLTQFVMTKELKHCPKIEDLRCSDSVKKKAAEFVKKYMSKFGEVYKRTPPS